jgi:hypothetical protein
MSEQNPFDKTENKLPSLLNVLTILSIIGCVFQLFSIPLGKWGMSFASKALEDPETLSKLSAKDVADLNKSKTMLDLMNANSLPLWIVTILSVALCFYGVLQMRKLKKEGFYLYSIGELIPLIGTGIIIGFGNQFNGTSSYVIGIGLPLLFIVLYYTQTKFMK